MAKVTRAVWVLTCSSFLPLFSSIGANIPPPPEKPEEPKPEEPKPAEEAEAAEKDEPMAEPEPKEVQ